MSQQPVATNVHHHDGLASHVAALDKVFISQHFLTMYSRGNNLNPVVLSS